MVAACQLAGEDGSVFSRPKSPSDAALSDAPLARHQVAVTVGRIMIFSDWLSRYRFRSAATTPTLNALGLPAVNWCTLKGALVNYRLAMPIAARSVKKSQIMKRSNHSSVAIIGFCIASFPHPLSRNQAWAPRQRVMQKSWLAEQSNTTFRAAEPSPTRSERLMDGSAPGAVRAIHGLHDLQCK